MWLSVTTAVIKATTGGHTSGDISWSVLQARWSRSGRWPCQVCWNVHSRVDETDDRWRPTTSDTGTRESDTPPCSSTTLPIIHIWHIDDVLLGLWVQKYPIINGGKFLEIYSNPVAYLRGWALGDALPKDFLAPKCRPKRRLTRSSRFANRFSLPVICYTVFLHEIMLFDSQENH